MSRSNSSARADEEKNLHSAFHAAAFGGRTAASRSEGRWLNLKGLGKFFLISILFWIPAKKIRIA